MLVKVNTSLAGANFDFRFGQEVDSEVFSALVGNGWESLCDPVVGADAPAVAETADLPTVEEAAVEPEPIEVAVIPAPERRARRK